MSQYTSSQTTPSGMVVNSILDTESNTITYTVTAPNGTIATSTQNADASGSSSANLTNLRNQLQAGGVVADLNLPLLRAVRDTSNNVRNQVIEADRATAVTGEPPPAEKEAIPVQPPTDPALTEQQQQIAAINAQQIANNGGVDPNAVDPAVQAQFDRLNANRETVNYDQPPSISEQIAAVNAQQIANNGGLDPNQIDPAIQAQFDRLNASNENRLQQPPDVDPNEDPFEASRLAAEENYNNTPQVTEADILAGSTNQGITAPKAIATSGATNQDQNNFIAQEDWRVRLSLAPGAKYLYAGPNPGILKPLADTRGVIFPYTPNIQINYSANYDATDLTHSNYKVYQYKNSNVDNITISCDFTAQDTYEANYLLAVVHFFRSVTKMFYGQDQFPKPGTPPPLCFLIGLGEFQFNDHPLAITSFNYSLPSDVDYIRAGTVSGLAGVNQRPSIRPVNTYDVSQVRLQGIKKGGQPLDAEFGSLTPYNVNVTYVPTKMQIQIGAIPIMSRNDISNNFSLNDYASGKLLRGIQNVRGGFW